MTKTNGLLPCPFCGRKATYSGPYGNWTNSHAVICGEGHAVVIGKTEREAKETWNARAGRARGPVGRSGRMNGDRDGE